MWKLCIMKTIADVTFDLDWWGLFWEGGRPAAAHDSCFPLCSPLLIAPRRFTLVMKWSRLIGKLWWVSCSITDLPLFLLGTTGAEWMGSGGCSGVFLVKCLRNVLTSHFQDKSYSLQYFDKINMQYLFAIFCASLKYFMLHLRHILKCLVAIYWNADKEL